MKQVAEAKMWKRKEDDIPPNRIASDTFPFQTLSTLKDENEAKE